MNPVPKKLFIQVNRQASSKKPQIRNSTGGDVLCRSKGSKREDIVVLVDLRTVNRLRLAGLGRPGRGVGPPCDQLWMP